MPHLLTGDVFTLRRLTGDVFSFGEETRRFFRVFKKKPKNTTEKLKTSPYGNLKTPPVAEKTYRLVSDMNHLAYCWSWATASSWIRLFHYS